MKSYETLQATARQSALFHSQINGMSVVQGELPPRQEARHHRLQRLRRNRRRLLQRVDLSRQRPKGHRFHHLTRMGKGQLKGPLV